MAELAIAPLSQRRRSGPALAAIRAERTKLFTLRSARWLMATGVVLTIGIGALVGVLARYEWPRMSLFQRATFDPTPGALAGLLLCMLLWAALAITSVTGEYASGTIRATVVAIPSRTTVLVAKVAVIGAVVLVLGEVATFGAFFACQLVLAGAVPTAHLGDPGVLRTVADGGLYLAGMSLLAMGVAWLLRRAALAFSAFFGLLFVLPVVTIALPGDWRQTFFRYLPGSAGGQLVTHHVHPGDLSPALGGLVLLGYLATALVAGGVLLYRRDVS
jgi:ABC-2 type transport system permease protein